MAVYKNRMRCVAVQTSQSKSKYILKENKTISAGSQTQQYILYLS